MTPSNMGAISSTSFIYSVRSEYICGFFARNSVLYVCNVGYSPAVYPVLYGLQFTVLWSLYMFIYTTFIDAVRAIFTPEKVDSWFFLRSILEAVWIFLEDYEKDIHIYCGCR